MEEGPDYVLYTAYINFVVIAIISFHATIGRRSIMNIILRESVMANGSL